MAPRGNPRPTGSKPDKLMRDAIMIAINREAVSADGRPTKKLHLVVEKLVDLAIEGDMGAIHEICDRVDGKPPSEATLTVTKHDATDWSRDELVSLIHDARARSNGAAKANGCGGEPDSVH